MQPTLTSKHMPLVVTDNFEIYLEYNQDFAILHLPKLEKFNRKTYSHLKDIAPRIKDFLFLMGYTYVHAAVYEGDERIMKLLSRFGFEYLATAEGFNVMRIDNGTTS